MKAGDLVTPVVPPGHGSPRIRLYDIPVHVVDMDETQLGSFRFPKVVTKMEEGECGLVTEVGEVLVQGIATDLHARVLIRGILGWTKCTLLKVVEP